MSNPEVSIVIATSFRYNLLQRCLESIKNQSFKNYEIILIGIKKDKKLSEIANKFGARLYYDQGKGRCYARNLGIKHSKGEIIVFLDDDVILEPNWLDLIVRTFNIDSSIGGVGGLPTNVPKQMSFLSFFSSITNRIQGLSNWKNAAFPIKVNYLSGCNMAFRQECLLCVNGFDENFYGTSAGEDADLCLRILKCGFSLILVPKAKVWHFSNFIKKTLLHKKDISCFFDLADNATYWRVKNKIITGFKWIPYLIICCIKAFYFMALNFNVKIFFYYISGVISGYIRGKSYSCP